MPNPEQLIASHHEGLLLNIVYAFRYTPGELELIASQADERNEPVVAEILRAAALIVAAAARR